MVKEFKQGEIYETWNEENSGGLLRCIAAALRLWENSRKRQFRYS